MKNNMECDPDLCGKCFLTSQHPKKNLCQNNSLFFNIQKVRRLKNVYNSGILKKRTVVGKSKICDSYGLFNVHPIKKGEFVLPYVGELITQFEAGYRDQINSIDQSFYIFDLNSEVFFV